MEASELSKMNFAELETLRQKTMDAYNNEPAGFKRRALSDKFDAVEEELEKRREHLLK